MDMLNTKMNDIEEKIEDCVNGESESNIAEMFHDNIKEIKRISNNNLRDIKKSNINAFVQFQKITTLSNQPILKKKKSFHRYRR